MREAVPLRTSGLVIGSDRGQNAPVSMKCLELRATVYGVFTRARCH